MYLKLQPLLEMGPDVSAIFVAALTSPQAVTDLLPERDATDPLLRRLQRVSCPGPIVLDLWEGDQHLSLGEIGQIVHAIRDHWHRHGFCIMRSADPQRWVFAASDHQQPLLYWRSLSPATGWRLLGKMLQGTELYVFQHLVNFGASTIDDIARDPLIFSQRPRFSDWRVQMDIAMGRISQGPSESNRFEAQNILNRMHQQRLVIAQRGDYRVVRPQWDGRD